MLDRVEAEIELLERHRRILRRVMADGPIGIVALSNETRYPEHKVRYSLRVLEESGAIEPTGEGAVATEQATAVLEAQAEQLDALVDRLCDLRPDAETVAAEP